MNFGTAGSLYQQLTGQEGQGAYKQQSSIEAAQQAHQTQLVQMEYNNLTGRGYQQVGNELSRGNVRNPSQITSDPTYGDITPISNVEHKTTGLTNVIDTVAPIAISAVMGNWAGPVMGSLLGTSSGIGSSIFGLGKSALASMGGSGTAQTSDYGAQTQTPISNNTLDFMKLFPSVFSSTSSSSMEDLQSDLAFNEIINDAEKFIMPEFVYGDAF